MQTEEVAEDLQQVTLDELQDQQEGQEGGGMADADYDAAGGAEADEEDAESDFTEEEEDHEVKRDLHAFGIYRVLPVHGEPDFSSGPPESAEEYLRRVRYEAAGLPDVVTSAIDPRSFDERRTSWSGVEAGAIPEAPDYAKPSHQWIVQFLQDFVRVRSDLEQAEESGAFEQARVPGEGDRGSWQTFCMGNGSGAEPQQPTMPILMAIDQVRCGLLLKWHTDWAVASRSVSQQSATWLYALTARLQRPLTQGIMAALRGLLRHCAQLRVQVKNPEDPLLANLNILIAISGAFFGQDESLAGIWEDGMT